MNTDGNRGFGREYFRLRDQQLVRKLRQLPELTDYSEVARLRVVGAVERELDAMAEEAWKCRGGVE